MNKGINESIKASVMIPVLIINRDNYIFDFRLYLFRVKIF